MIGCGTVNDSDQNESPDQDKIQDLAQDDIADLYQIDTVDPDWVWIRTINPDPDEILDLDPDEIPDPDEIMDDQNYILFFFTISFISLCHCHRLSSLCFVIYLSFKSSPHISVCVGACATTENLFRIYLLHN